MEATIERLRASKQKDEEQNLPQYVVTGREWAMKQAEYSPLKRLGDAEELEETESQIQDIVRRVFGDDPTEHEIASFMEEVCDPVNEPPSHHRQLCWRAGVR